MFLFVGPATQLQGSSSNNNNDDDIESNDDGAASATPLINTHSAPATALLAPLPFGCQPVRARAFMRRNSLNESVCHCVCVPFWRKLQHALSPSFVLSPLSYLGREIWPLELLVSFFFLSRALLADWRPRSQLSSAACFRLIDRSMGCSTSSTSRLTPRT